MECKRSYSEINEDDLSELVKLSKLRIEKFFKSSSGMKWNRIYEYKKPLCIALCQGSAMHYYDNKYGIKDFDIWFFYAFSKQHLPYRTIWNIDYINEKFGHNPDHQGYEGRKVDIIIRSIKNYINEDPIESIYEYFANEKTKSAIMLSKKAVVLLEPSRYLGKVIWYKGNRIK